MDQKNFEIFFFFNIPHYRSSHRRCSVGKVFLEMLQNSQENTCARVSFLIKLQALGLEHISHLCSSVFIVNFEQVNAGWVGSQSRLADIETRLTNRRIN